MPNWMPHSPDQLKRHLLALKQLSPRASNPGLMYQCMEVLEEMGLVVGSRPDDWQQGPGHLIMWDLTDAGRACDPDEIPAFSSSREQEIAERLNRGETQKQIAERFGISHQRVNQIVKRLSLPKT